MHEYTASLEVDCQNSLGEAALWCWRSGCFYWIDMLRPGKVQRWDPTEKEATFHEFDELVTGLALAGDGALVVVGERTVYQFCLLTGKRDILLELPCNQPNHRFNDAGCDRNGRLWVGSMFNNIAKSGSPLPIAESTGKLHMIDSCRGEVTYEENLGCPNAICWSPDSRVQYVADSCNGWIYKYNYDLVTGRINHSSDFARFLAWGVPDGACVDSEGYIWNARWGAGVVLRISPQGDISDIVYVDSDNPTSCALGGDDLRTLYITTARYGLDSMRLKSRPHSGSVFSVRVKTAGLNEAEFQALCPE